MGGLSFGYVWPAAVLTVAALAASVSAARAQDGTQPMDLGRFIITQLTAESPATIRAQLTFQVLMSIPLAEWDAARSATPAYRDIVIRAAYGYAAYSARNGIDPSPERLAHLIVTRIGDNPAMPIPLFITLPNFQEVRPSVPDGGPRAPR